MRQWWTISITGQGSFQLFGTASEARGTCERKAKRPSVRATCNKASAPEAAIGLRKLRYRESRGLPLDARQTDALSLQRQQ